MYESMTTELNNKLNMANLKASNAEQKGQQIGNAISEISGAIQQGFTYNAQSKINKDQYELKQRLLAGKKDYLDVDNENASTDYSKWANNELDAYLSDKGALYKSIFNNNYRQSLLDNSRLSFDEDLVTAMDNRNKLNWSESWQNAINAFTDNDPDTSVAEFSSPMIYRTTFGADGMQISHEGVDVGDVYEMTGDERTDSFNELLNTLYHNTCLVMSPDEAKMYVDSQIDTIENQCMANDIVQLVNERISDSKFGNERSIIDDISSMYLQNNRKPYTGGAITESESVEYRALIEKYVDNAWALAQETTINSYNENVVPALLEVERNGYVTSEVFNRAMDNANIDRRFAKSITDKWDTVLKTNDAMAELEVWFESDQPMSENLSSYAKNFVTYDTDTGDWSYTSSAGYILSSGLYDRSRMSATNRAIAEQNVTEGNEAMLGYEQNMQMLYDWWFGNPNDGNPIEAEFKSLTEGKDLSESQIEAVRQQLLVNRMDTYATDKYHAMRMGATNTSEVLERVNRYSTAMSNIETAQKTEDAQAEIDANIAEGEQYIPEFVNIYNSLNQYGTPDQTDDNEIQKYLDHTLPDNATPEERLRAEADIREELQNRADELEQTMTELGVDLTKTKSEIGHSKEHALSMAEGMKEITETREDAERTAQRQDLDFENYGLDRQAEMLVYANRLIGYDSRSDMATNIAMTYSISAMETELADAGFNVDEIYARELSDDPLDKGISDEKKAEITKYAEDNNIDYWSAYTAVMCDNEQEEYAMKYKMLLAGSYELYGGENSLIQPSTCVQNMYSRGLSVWEQSLAKSCDDYNNRVGVFNGNLMEVTNENGDKFYVPMDNETPSNYPKAIEGGTLEERKTKAKENIKNSSNQSESIGDGALFNNVISLLGTKDIYGNTITLADIRLSSLYMALSDEEKKTIDAMTYEEAGKVILGSIDREGSLAKAIDSYASNDVAKSNLWMMAIKSIRSEYDVTTDNAEQVVSNAISLVQKQGVNAFVNDMSGLGKSIDAFIGKKGNISDKLVADVKSDGADRVKETDTAAQKFGVNENVDSFINNGLSKGAGAESLDMFAQKDLQQMGDDKIIDACFITAFKMYGHEGLYNADTDWETQMSSLNSQIYDDDGNMYKDEKTYRLASDLFQIKAAASQLYEVSTIMKTLENGNLNLGHVESVNGNTYKMSSGVTVVASYDNQDKLKLEVVSLDGLTRENVNDFMSNSVTLQRMSDSVSRTINEDSTFLQYKYAFKSNIGLTTDENGELHPTPILDENPEHNNITEWGYMNNRGIEMVQNIDWSQYPKFTDGQVDKQWAEAFGYTPPTLYSGSSLNGLDYNYRITTNSKQTYTSELPVSLVKKVGTTAAEMAKTGTTSWWADFWRGISEIGRIRYGVDTSEFTNKIFGE